MYIRAKPPINWSYHKQVEDVRWRSIIYTCALSERRGWGDSIYVDMLRTITVGDCFFFECRRLRRLAVFNYWLEKLDVGVEILRTYNVVSSSSGYKALPVANGFDARLIFWQPMGA